LFSPDCVALPEKSYKKECQEKQKPELARKLEIIDVSTSFEPKTSALRFPFKCTVKLRNESPGPIDVRLLRYDQQLVSLKDFSSQAFKIKFENKWYPDPDSAIRIAVLPNQEFKV
jgi:hypothetical protein